MNGREPLILSAGTQVVTAVDLRGDNGGVRVPRGAVGIVATAPADATHAYRVTLQDPLRNGETVSLRRDQLLSLAAYQAHGLAPQLFGGSLFDRVILRVVIGSRAYGLEQEGSDTDRRGVFLPTAEQHWSLFSVPEQIDDDPAQETFWELQKFCLLGLKANPNVLECLWSPLVEQASALGRELLSVREAFLSRLVFQTYSGYVASQFRKIQAVLRRDQEPKWKHVMHLVRLQLAGIGVLASGSVPVDVGEHRERLLEIRSGQLAWPRIDRWRQELQREFEDAAATTDLPERPDYERVDAFVRRARRLALAQELP
ncbi:MAG: nucleotidyltransferase domain-containing protein [Planctomycetota bacterium]